MICRRSPRWKPAKVRGSFRVQEGLPSPLVRAFVKLSPQFGGRGGSGTAMLLAEGQVESVEVSAEDGGIHIHGG